MQKMLDYDVGTRFLSTMANPSIFTQKSFITEVDRTHFNKSGCFICISFSPHQDNITETEFLPEAEVLKDAEEEDKRGEEAGRQIPSDVSDQDLNPTFSEFFYSSILKAIKSDPHELTHSF